MDALANVVAAEPNAGLERSGGLDYQCMYGFWRRIGALVRGGALYGLDDCLKERCGEGEEREDKRGQDRRGQRRERGRGGEERRAGESRGEEAVVDKMEKWEGLSWPKGLGRTVICSGPTTGM